MGECKSPPHTSKTKICNQGNLHSVALAYPNTRSYRFDSNRTLLPKSTHTVSNTSRTKDLTTPHIDNASIRLKPKLENSCSRTFHPLLSISHTLSLVHQNWRVERMQPMTRSSSTKLHDDTKYHPATLPREHHGYCNAAQQQLCSVSV